LDYSDLLVVSIGAAAMGVILMLAVSISTMMGSKSGITTFDPPPPSSFFLFFFFLCNQEVVPAQADTPLPNDSHIEYIFFYLLLVVRNTNLAMKAPKTLKAACKIFDRTNQDTLYGKNPFKKELKQVIHP